MNCLSVYNIHDPLGRRIAKKVNGVITEKYLWSGLTTLPAVYDGSNNLLMRFEYADSRLPFAVMKSGVLYYTDSPLKLSSIFRLFLRKTGFFPENPVF